MPFSVRSVVPASLAMCDGSYSFLQSGFWGSFKARFSWNARAFLVDWDGGETLPLLVIRRRLAPGVSFAYIPWGPELPSSFAGDDHAKTIALESLAIALRSQLPPDTTFIRFDPPWPSSGADMEAPVLHAPFCRSGADIQAPDTVIVDLRPSLDQILSSMKPKWRYNIRLAEKKGVSVRRADASGVPTFYKLYQETAQRDRIAIHGIAYYETLFSHASEYGPQAPDIRLYLAEFEGTAIAGIVAVFHKSTAVYLYGASSDEKRSYMPAYALQWQAMKDAKAFGCMDYDLFGIPPRSDPKHPMTGLYRFKTGFGGTVVHRCGSWDYAYKPFACHVFRLAEGFRKRLRTIRKSLRKGASDS